MTYYAVIDTNVIVSSMLNNDSIPGRIMQYVSSGIIIPLLNEEILKEYSEVITRNKFGFTQISIDVLLKELKEKSLYIEREQTLEEFIDKDDIVFFEIVLSARTTMDAYLITGNMKHYPIRSYIVTPREMIEIIDKDNQVKKNRDNL